MPANHSAKAGGSRSASPLRTDRQPSVRAGARQLQGHPTHLEENRDDDGGGGGGGGGSPRQALAGSTPLRSVRGEVGEGGGNSSPVRSSPLLSAAGRRLVSGDGAGRDVFSKKTPFA